MSSQRIQTEGKLLRRGVYVTVAECGGTGSQTVSLLARLHLALLANGHPEGLRVTVFDPDCVTEANIGRQLFYQSDAGKHKAEVLVKRVNFAYGLNWDYRNCGCSGGGDSDFVIGCVDSIKARNLIYGSRAAAVYRIDCGNGADYGQVLLEAPGFPTLEQMAPELIAGEDSVDDGPSCSLAEALTKQELLVNDFAARIAVQMIWELLRRGGIEYNAVFYNLKAMTMRKAFKIKN